MAETTGFMQKEGIEYNKVFAPASKHTSIRAMPAIAAVEDVKLHQLDIKTAFLHGGLRETTNMQQPEGYAEGALNMVCHLRESLYGLKHPEHVSHASSRSYTAWASLHQKQTLKSSQLNTGTAEPTFSCTVMTS